MVGTTGLYGMKKWQCLFSIANSCMVFARYSRISNEYPPIVLNLTNASSAIRTVLVLTRVGSRMLKPGYMVMCPSWQLHCDAKVFGSDANLCEPDRFS